MSASQVSQVFQVIEFVRLLELAKFTTDFHLERLLVDCVRYNDMQIRIDHGKRCIHFGVDLSEAQREDHPDGPVLQAMPSEQIRTQLMKMVTVLCRATNIINPNKRMQERDKQRAAMVAHYHETKVKEHQRILGRHKIIEERKEYIEHMNFMREEEEMRRQEELQRQQLLAEQKRLEQEREERERKRQQSEIQQIKDRTKKEKMQQISQTSHGQKVGIGYILRNRQSDNYQILIFSSKTEFFWFIIFYNDKSSYIHTINFLIISYVRGSKRGKSSIINELKTL